MSTLFSTVTYQPETCCNCGIPFAMSMEFYNQRRTNGGTFHCPNGHAQHYTKPKVTLLEEQLQAKDRELEAKERAQNLLRQERDFARSESDHFRKSRNITRGLLKRIKQRNRAGVCACCNRTFQNLLSHMKTKHPNFGNEPEEKA